MRRSCVARVEPDAPLPCPSSTREVRSLWVAGSRHNGSSRRELVAFVCVSKYAHASALRCAWVGTGEDKA